MQDTDFTIDALHAAYGRQVSPHDMVAELFARIAAADDAGIFLHLETEAALHAAVDRLGAFDPVAHPLWGIPFAVKDNIDTAGTPTTAACPAFAYRPVEDAPVVAALRAAGAIFVGKTNLDQFATGLVGVRTPHPVPRNAVDPCLVPGGSSSGSAVAVARGIVTFALGTDTAGSGRVPAALNDIVGLKPSLGALSTRGVVPACRTLDCVSVFARSVGDAWRAFAAMAGHDPADPYSRSRDVLSPRGGTAAPILAIPDAGSRRFFGDTVQEAAFAAAIEALSRRGFRLVERDIAPLHAVAGMLYEGAWVAERLAAIADFLPGNEGALHPTTLQIIAGARGLTAVDAFNGFYRLEALRREAQALLRDVDFLCLPSIPTLYTLEDLAADPIGPNSRLGTYTNFVNLLDMCGIAVPAGKRGDGRPFGLTFLAPGGSDRDLAELAARICGQAMPPAATRGSANPSTDRIEIVIVGAHLSGMPLNHELRSLGAVLVRPAATLPDYRLYALPGTEPVKPGLLRVAPGEGASIEVEVWSLVPDAFARFVAAIPSPLGIGSIALDDGCAIPGFLAEGIAVANAQDITAFGGWRRYLQSVGRTATAPSNALAPPGSA